MPALGKLLIVAGFALLTAGFLTLLLGRAGLAVGKLPGDLIYRGKHTTVYFPLMTSVALSVVLTLVLWLISKFHR